MIDWIQAHPFFRVMIGIYFIINIFLFYYLVRERRFESSSIWGKISGTFTVLVLGFLIIVSVMIKDAFFPNGSVEKDNEKDD